MASITLHRYFFLLFIGLFLLSNCKTENGKVKKADKAVESVHTDPIKNDAHSSNSNQTSRRDTSDRKKDNKSIQEELKEEEKNNSVVEAAASSTTKKPKRKVDRKRPKIQFEELDWNFGEIIEGDIIEKKFKFTNTGNAPLQIIATSATCGCTRPSFPFLDIAPGESNIIGVTYNSVGKDGRQNPEVTVESNTMTKITTLKLHGIVKPRPKKDEKLNSSAVTKDSVSRKQ